jgi:hypothetical protein
MLRNGVKMVEDELEWVDESEWVEVSRGVGLGTVGMGMSWNGYELEWVWMGTVGMGRGRK